MPVGLLDEVVDEEEADRRVALDVLLERVALKQLKEREEDRELEQQRPARGQRVDLVLAVERHHLALQAFLVALVLLLQRLELGRVLLQVAHRADLLDRERQDQQARDEGESDDRHAPGDADVIAEEEEHGLGRVDQRLQDVGEHHQAGAPVLGSEWSQSRWRSRNRLRSESSSTPPWLHGLQRASRQAATTVPRTIPSSRTACTA